MRYVCISHSLLHISIRVSLRQLKFDTAKSEFMTLLPQHCPCILGINDRKISSNPRKWELSSTLSLIQFVSRSHPFYPQKPLEICPLSAAVVSALPIS